MRKDYLAAFSQAKLARSKARTILQNSLVPLHDDGHENEVHKVEALLGQTSSALKNLQDAALALRATAEERQGTGTQLSTEQMDLLDGIIVTLCRSARNAAKQAAKESGSSALVNDFAVTHIDETRAKPSAPPDAPSAPPAPAHGP